MFQAFSILRYEIGQKYNSHYDAFHPSEYGQQKMEITECEPLPDGRFFLEVESRRRFRILNHWDQDGYRVAEIEWVQDVCPAEGTREKAEIEAHVGSVNDLVFCFPNKQLCVVTCEEDRLIQYFEKKCPTFIAAVSRIQVVSNSLGTFAMLLVLLLGGFIVAKGCFLLYKAACYALSERMEQLVSTTKQAVSKQLSFKFHH
ncbi:hypothetical protein POM88_024374 [Heracleum sosnowskyi]|uniref:Lon N-terminal domain-containing protein n=1 Tax=Heracleum sosnowskyi TaxID=360622 RepID=A0AAD8I2T9_9APIA|nr:hypothetical protein POM88_024374 [Heracleum sosnowskyi]